MKFCYLDESGTGDEPYAVMVGIIVDVQRMHLTKRDWENLLALLSNLVGRQVTEIHTRDFYPGNSPWRDLAGDVRAQIISSIFDWLRDRRHHIVYSAVNKVTFQSNFCHEQCFDEIETLWRFMALHVCLAIQKQHQRLARNKGHTVLVFDNEECEAREFIKLIRNPPEWTDTYYNRKPNQERLDQIVDVPYFGDSRHVGLIQVADIVSFFLRRYVELQEDVVPPRYEDEDRLVNDWAGSAIGQAIQKSAIYPARGRCECAELFYRYGPSCLL
jgi:hypothetical protein